MHVSSSLLIPPYPRLIRPLLIILFFFLFSFHLLLFFLFSFIHFSCSFLLILLRFFRLLPSFLFTFSIFSSFSSSSLCLWFVLLHLLVLTSYTSISLLLFRTILFRIFPVFSSFLRILLLFTPFSSSSSSSFSIFSSSFPSSSLCLCFLFLYLSLDFLCLLNWFILLFLYLLLFISFLSPLYLLFLLCQLLLPFLLSSLSFFFPPPPYRQTLRRNRVLENGNLERILVLLVLPITETCRGGGWEGSWPSPPLCCRFSKIYVDFMWNPRNPHIYLNFTSWPPPPPISESYGRPWIMHCSPLFTIFEMSSAREASLNSIQLSLRDGSRTRLHGDGTLAPQIAQKG